MTTPSSGPTRSMRSQPDVESIVLRAEHEPDQAGMGIRYRRGVEKAAGALDGGKDAHRPSLHAHFLLQSSTASLSHALALARKRSRLPGTNIQDRWR